MVSASVIRRREGSFVALARSSLMVVLMDPSLTASCRFFCVPAVDCKCAVACEGDKIPRDELAEVMNTAFQTKVESFMRIVGEMYLRCKD